MRAFLAAVLLVSASIFGWGNDLPAAVKDAVLLELDGHLAEALEAYRTALTTEASLIQDEALARPFTVLVLSKAAHLSIDLGLGEEAWDLGGRLLSAKNQRAAAAGTLVRLRLLRIQGKLTQAKAAFEAYVQAWPLPAPPPALLMEERSVLKSLGQSSASFEAVLTKEAGPADRMLRGDWSLLSSPSAALGVTVQEVVRLQVGAFKDWSNALTLVDMLREKGWSPLTEVKTGPQGVKLHVVYLVSRQPASDRARLEAQGLTALPN